MILHNRILSWLFNMWTLFPQVSETAVCPFFQNWPTELTILTDQEFRWGPTSQWKNRKMKKQTNLNTWDEEVPRTFSDNRIAHRAPSVFEILNGFQRAQQKQSIFTSKNIFNVWKTSQKTSIPSHKSTQKTPLFPQNNLRKPTLFSHLLQKHHQLH